MLAAEVEEALALCTRIKTEAKLLTQQQEDLESTMEALEVDLLQHQQAQQLLRLCLESKLDIREQMETTVNLVLTASFAEDPIRFVLVDVEKDGVVKGVECCGYELTNPEVVRPITDFGGGVANVVSDALRLFCTVVSESENIMILDEPSTNLDVDRCQPFVDILNELCDKFEIQRFVVTHLPMDMPVTYKVEKANGQSRVTLISAEKMGEKD